MRELVNPLAALSVIGPSASLPTGGWEPNTPPRKTIKEAASPVFDEDVSIPAVIESSSKHRRGSWGQVVGLDEENRPSHIKEATRRSPILESASNAQMLADARVAALRAGSRNQEVSEASSEAFALGRKGWAARELFNVLVVYNGQPLSAPKTLRSDILRAPLSPRRGRRNASPLGTGFTSRVNMT